MALALSVLVITGQTLNCCRLNESISASIGRALESILPGDAPKPAAALADPPKTHAGCHGHVPAVGTEPPFRADASDGPLYQVKEACLSDVAFSPGYSQPVPDPYAGLSAQAESHVRVPALPPPSRFEKPRPRNKSSPPLYLLTRRILV